MSVPRLALLALPLALGLSLLAGGCAPVALTAASYGADGVSLAETGKSTSDHFASMVSRKDCALWRMFRSQKICREREGTRDPYKVDYDRPTPQPSEDGVSYAPPLHAAPDAPAASWTADSYKPAPAAPVDTAATTLPTEAAPAMAGTEITPLPASAPKAAPKPKPAKKAKVRTVKKPSRGQAASAP